MQSCPQCRGSGTVVSNEEVKDIMTSKIRPAQGEATSAPVSVSGCGQCGGKGYMKAFDGV